MSIVYTGGTFDLPHAGHVNFLRQCRKIAGIDGVVFVSLNTDEFIREYKGKAPIMSYEERKTVLMAYKFVDVIIPNRGGADSKPAISDAMPNIIAIGTDWAKKDYYKQMGFTQEWLNKHRINLIYLPYTKGISTTELKKRINAK